MSLFDLVQPVRLTSKVAAGAVGAPVRTTAPAAEVVKQGAAVAEGAPRQAVRAPRALLDPRTRRTHRRVSAGVRRALPAVHGVRRAEIDAVTGQVLAAFALGLDAD